MSFAKYKYIILGIIALCEKIQCHHVELRGPLNYLLNLLKRSLFDFIISRINQSTCMKLVRWPSWFRTTIYHLFIIFFFVRNTVVRSNKYMVHTPLDLYGFRPINFNKSTNWYNKSNGPKTDKYCFCLHDGKIQVISIQRWRRQQEKQNCY